MLTRVRMEQTDPAQLGFDPERLERVLGAEDSYHLERVSRLSDIAVSALVD